MTSTLNPATGTNVANSTIVYEAVKHDPRPNVYQAVAMVAADVGAIEKDRQVQHGERFKYRGIDDVLNALHGPLSKHGVVIVPMVEHVARDDRPGYGKGGWYELSAIVRFKVYGPRGDHIETAVPASALDNADKATGKLMSYAYKTMAFQLFSIPTDSSIDNEADTPPPEAREPRERGRVESMGADDEEAKMQARRDRLKARIDALDEMYRADLADQAKKLGHSLKTGDMDALVWFHNEISAFEQAMAEDAKRVVAPNEAAEDPAEVEQVVAAIEQLTSTFEAEPAEEFTEADEEPIDLAPAEFPEIPRSDEAQMTDRALAYFVASGGETRGAEDDDITLEVHSLALKILAGLANGRLTRRSNEGATTNVVRNADGSIYVPGEDKPKRAAKKGAADAAA